MKKGFTLTELLAVIVILGVISTIAVVSYRKYMKNAKEDYYSDAETSMKAAAESLITYCDSTMLGEDFCVSVPAVGSSVTIDLPTLVEHNFIKQITDQKTGRVCNGTVTITSKTQNSVNYQLDYKVCLRCDNHTTTGC